MNPDIKERWLALLESGEYKFGKKKLYNVETDCHCALGVLVEMAIEAGVFEPKVTHKYGYKSLELDGFRLNDSIREWAGIRMGTITVVSEINDYQSNNNFDEVIKYIREQL